MKIKRLLISIGITIAIILIGSVLLGLLCEFVPYAKVAIDALIGIVVIVMLTSTIYYDLGKRGKK